MIHGNLTDMLSELPRKIEQKDPEGGVTQPWVRKLPLRYQGVLLTAIRGCDVAPKEDHSKWLTRLIRRAVMNPAVSEESTYARGFFGFERQETALGIEEFLHSLDQYPLHYVMHLFHAAEVIGYEHPLNYWREPFLWVYHHMCHAFHVQPETQNQMYHRLVTHDRIASGTVERNF